MTRPKYEEAKAGVTVDRRYQVRREIARGGMGAVFEAEHAFLKSPVALKTLTRQALDVPSVHARLMREARALSRTRHPNVVPVFDAGVCDLHGPYVALDMIEGRTLESFLVARQKLDIAETLAVVAQLASALDWVHQKGVIHRDVKPANVLVSREPGRDGDTAILVDFGIARVPGEVDVVDGRLTRHGEVLGTVEYMAPEQLAEGREPDARTDVWALGVLAYECLTGDVPFTGTPTQVMTALLQGQKPPELRARRADVPEPLSKAVMRALNHAPAQRPQSAGELVRAMEQALGITAPPILLIDTVPDAVRSVPPSATAADLKSSGNAPVRRLFARAPYVTPTRIVTTGGPCDGRSEDISEGGLLVVTSAECTDGDRVKVRLPLPTSGRVVVLEAIARWSKNRRGQRAIGVEFVDPPEEVRAEIRTYVTLMSGVRSIPPT